MLEDPHGMVAHLIRTTKTVWKGARLDDLTSKTEPMHVAWLRLFGEPKPLPIFCQVFEYQGSDCVFYVFPGGRCVIEDVLRGSEIRDLKPEVRVMVERTVQAIDPRSPHRPGLVLQ